MPMELLEELADVELPICVSSPADIDSGAAVALSGSTLERTATRPPLRPAAGKPLATRASTLLSEKP
jgi:hypothetical protein